MATRLDRLIVRLKIKGVRNSGKAQEISKNATTFCDYCRAIDLEQLTKEAPDGSSQTGLLHHASYKDLCKSAKRGCALCSLIQEYGRSRRVSERDASSSARRIYCSAIDWSGRDGSLLFNSLNWEQPFKGGLSTSLNIFVSKGTLKSVSYFTSAL